MYIQIVGTTMKLWFIQQPILNLFECTWFSEIRREVKATGDIFLAAKWNVVVIKYIGTHNFCIVTLSLIKQKL